jgi:putative phosphoesterase
LKIGIVSDTHGLLRPELFPALAGVEHVLHAGDIGGVELLTELEAIAPVTAVWGNTDGWDVRSAVPEIARVELGGTAIAVLHGHQMGTPDPPSVAARFPDAGLAVFGHTHRPVIQRSGGVWVVNPGSAGPRRFSLPVSIAIAEIEDGIVDVKLVTLTA